MSDLNPSTVLGAIQQLGESLGNQLKSVSEDVKAMRETLGDHAIQLVQVPALQKDLDEIKGRVKTLEDADKAMALTQATEGVRGKLLWGVGGMIGTVLLLAVAGALFSLVLRPAGPTVSVTSHP